MPVSTLVPCLPEHPLCTPAHLRLRVTTGQAATAEAKRAPLRPTHSALKCFDLVLSNMLLWQGAADFS